MKLDPNVQQTIKAHLGKKAASLVEDGMLVGLGTGTTATFFIDHLIKRCQEGLNISAVSSSVRSLDQAKKGGIPVLDMDAVTSIDLTIDSADEIDSQARMIKGGGGALVREKIVASTSKKMVVIVDESKLVDQLGLFGLPVEIIPFGSRATMAKLNTMGFEGILRKNNKGQITVTDNGNHIFDIHSPKNFTAPEETHRKILSTPGVVDTGFFFNLATAVLVGYSNGRVEFKDIVRKA